MLYMKRLIFLIVLIILLTGCISEEYRVTEDISYDEKVSDYEFNQSDYNETYLELEYRSGIRLEGDQFEDNRTYQIIHIKTFAPSTNHKLVIEDVYSSHKQTSTFGITPIGHTAISHTGWKLFIDAKVTKTGDIGGSAITPLKKSVIINYTPIKEVELNVNNTINGDSNCLFRQSASGLDLKGECR